MRSRLSLFMNDLSLEEILYLEEELDRRKERYRRHYSVLSVQAVNRILTHGRKINLGALARDMRRLLEECAAVGGGTLLAYSPEVSVLLFNTVADASRTCAALLSALPEFNGRGGGQSYEIDLKLGLASGKDTLAPGSPRCVRRSQLVKRANQCAWRGTAGTLLLDDVSSHEWPDKYAVERVPIDIDGVGVYRVVPGMLGNDGGRYNNEELIKYLDSVRSVGISTIKYDLERIDENAENIVKWGKLVPTTKLLLQAFDPAHNQNLTYYENVATSEFEERMESVRRILSTLNLALVRHDKMVASETAGAN